MTKISITLNQDYKSFKSGFTSELNGKLIILSGINGSGKSQLINILKGSEQVEAENGIPYEIRHLEIKRKVNIDGKLLMPKKVEFRSFKDNINLPEVTKSTSAISTQAVDQAYLRFTQGNLDPARLPSYASSCIQANLILERKFGKINKSLSERDFKTTLRESNFIWRNEDQFTDIIGVIFYNHAIAVAQGQQEAGKNGGAAFDPNSIGVAPWTELNNLFNDLKLDYRFKKNYEIFHAELNETPCLYSIDQEGVIIENEARSLKDLLNSTHKCNSLVK